MRKLLAWAFILTGVALFYAVCSGVGHSEDLHARLAKQDRPKTFGRGFFLSTGIYAGGAAADIFSSRGHYELNPWARDNRGRFSTRNALALSGAGYLLPLTIQKMSPKAANVIRSLMGAGHLGMAVRNYRVTH